MRPDDEDLAMRAEQARDKELDPSRLGVVGTVPSNNPGSAVVRAEMSIIGACLIEPDLVDVVPVEERYFFNPVWRVAWRAMRRMREAGNAIDAVTVADFLETRGKTAVDMSILSDAELEAATAETVEHYAEIVRQSWVSREVLLACSDIDLAYREGLSGDDLLTRALERISKIDSGGPRQALTIGQVVTDRIKELLSVIDARERGELSATGTLSGISPLDGLLGGFQPNVTLVAARPGIGKSGFVLSVTDNVTGRGEGAHVFSLEDTRASYADRSLAGPSGVPAEDIRAVNFRAVDMHPLMAAANDLRNREGWLIDDRSGLTADEIVRSVRRHRRENGTKLVVVDYIQLIKGPPKVWDRQQILDHAATTFSNAAKADGIPYVVLSQLNRKCEERDNKRPIMADLRGAGELEERAKCIIFLYRPAKYEPNVPDTEIELIVAKNNHGRTGTVIADWHGPTMRVS